MLNEAMASQMPKTYLTSLSAVGRSKVSFLRPKRAAGRMPPRAGQLRLDLRPGPRTAGERLVELRHRPDRRQSRAMAAGLQCRIPVLRSLAGQPLPACELRSVLRVDPEWRDQSVICGPEVRRLCSAINTLPYRPAIQRLPSVVIPR